MNKPMGTGRERSQALSRQHLVGESMGSCLRVFVLLVFAVFCLNAAVHAAPFEFQAGFAARHDYSGGVIGAWENNSVFFVGISRELTRDIGIASRLGIRDGDFVHLVGVASLPEILHSPYRGGSLRALELTGALQVGGGDPIKATFTLGGGLVIASLPKVTRFAWDMDHPEAKYIEQAPGSGEVSVHGIIGMGVGALYPSRGWLGVGISLEFWWSPVEDGLIWQQLGASLEVR
jgi:hypothetical protein